MKKRLLLTAAMVLSILLVGCGETKYVCPEDGCGVELPEDDYCSSCCIDIPEETQMLEATDKVAQTTVEYDGIKFNLYEDGSAILDKLGTPSETEDMDDYKFNYYDGVQLEIVPTDDKPLFDYIYIDGTGFKANGIEVGASVDEVKAAFGEPSSEYECEGVYYIDYYYDGFAQYFNFENDKLTNFQFSRGCEDAE